MRLRYLVVLLVSLAVVAAIAGRKLVYAQISALDSPISSPAAQSYLIILGINDKAVTVWDGTITATGGTILSLQGWRFSGADTINGTAGWKTSTRMAPAGAGDAGTSLFQETGVIVTVAASNNPITFAVTTPHGNFSFNSRNITFGGGTMFLTGRALVAQTATPLQLTSSPEDEDYPSIAQSNDDIYLAYTRFVHGDRSLAQGINTKTTITDFSFLARPTGGDQVLLLHYSKSQRVWTGPFAITAAGEDAMRAAVAVDGLGRAWVFYSVQRSGNFDIYARNVRSDGTMSSEIRITSDPGTDIFPVAATDSSGRVWVAWQGFRNNNLEILTSTQLGGSSGNAFAPEAIVSTSNASDWEPAIAAAPDGDVAISWDTYDKGDYDVYVRRVHFTDQIGMDDPIAIAATNNFEARSSIAYDFQNRLWIAYEVSGPRWGKDFGAFDTTGIGLYQNHTVQVRVLIGNDVYSTVDDINNALPGQPQTQMFLATLKGPYPTQPDPTLAQKRTPNNGVGGGGGPKNSFPRLAVDPSGTVYIAFRRLMSTVGVSTGGATGQSVGSIWIGQMVYFDGATWHGAGVLGQSDGLGDNRPAITALSDGDLLIGQAMDHRLTPTSNATLQMDGVNSDIYALELPISRTQQTPQLQKIGTVTPSAPDAGAAVEASTLALTRSYRPTVNGQPLQLVRGDFHRHTELSFDGRGDGPLEDGYRYSIDAAGLDWIGCCDHDDGSAREYSWWTIQKFSDAYFLGPRFVPMYYYERSIAYPEGHRNVLFDKRGIRTLPRLPISDVASTAPAPDTNMLYAYLKFFGGVTAPHTTATDQGTDWRNNDPTVEPFVEIYQGDRQDYEMPGAPRANTSDDSISGYEASGYVSVALGKGYKLAFEASSDHVSTHISFTNLWVKTPTRAGIIDAMQNRRMYGSTDDIVADFRSGTHFMGETFSTASPPVFTVRLFGTAAFQNVSVIKNGNIVYSTSGDRVMSFTWQDPATTKGATSYYYVRGLQTDGQVVWVSPMWVTQQ
jgi:hypothetical protein